MTSTDSPATAAASARPLTVQEFVENALRGECSRLLEGRPANQLDLVSRAFPRGIDGTKEPGLRSMLALIYRTIAQEQKAAAKENAL